jgi:Rieske Fe-S protein
MATEDKKDTSTRRGFLESAGGYIGYIIGAPVIIGTLGAVLSPILRILRPTLEPFNLNQGEDLPPDADQIVAQTRDIPHPWDYKPIYYTARNVEYTPRNINEKMIAGYAVRVSQEVIEELADQINWRVQFEADGADAAREAFVTQGVFCFSRICPHLGCNFNAFRPDQTARVSVDYSFPGAVAGNPYFACPCHFSVYDLKQTDEQGRFGRVVSGPAPRPPFILKYRVQDGDIIVTGMEAGGVA